MSENIFVNCRTPYAKRIAERVLRGYDKAIATNISVVDLTEVKKQLESLKIRDSLYDRALQWLFEPSDNYDKTTRERSNAIMNWDDARELNTTDKLKLNES
jgi:L-fucose isomerase-like protein